MEIFLSRGEVLDLGKSAYRGTIDCLAGSCWLTCPGQPGDHLLASDESLSIEGQGALLVSALSDCRIRVQIPPVGLLRAEQKLQLSGAGLHT